MSKPDDNFVGTAGWSIPKTAAQHFPKDGTHLQRYSQVLNCVEINSSFYRSHAFTTYQRWAESTPASFQFAVKMPRSITHENRLRQSKDSVIAFLDEVNGLGKKLGPLLIQLPPSLAFETRVALTFFTSLRKLYQGQVVCEPRHASWFERRAEELLKAHEISRVAADPSVVPVAGEPGGATDRLIYCRLHGSPRMYWSSYSSEQLQEWVKKIRSHNSNTATWVIFDNTAAGHATANALETLADMRRPNIRRA
jgi:uncharacterized protein YecE (DUF72 family)